MSIIGARNLIDVGDGTLIAPPKPSFGGAFGPPSADLGRDTPGAGNGLGGSYASPTPGQGRDTPGSGGGTGGGYTPPPTSTEPTPQPTTPKPSPTPTGPPPPSGDGSTTKDTGPPVDWADVFWGSLGLPPDLVSQINQIFAKYPDQTQATALAQQTMRASTWYQQTFPGIQYGIKNGLFTDETGYRNYVNKLNVLSQQYNNAPITSNEVTGYLQAGQDEAYVANLYQGKAIAGAEGPTLQYQAGAFSPQGRLSDQELAAYGNEKAGIDTVLGQQVAARLQEAVTRMRGVFSGQNATPSLTLGTQGLFSPSLQGGRQQTNRSGNPDIGA